jgi:hypothetical protein
MSMLPVVLENLLVGAAGLALLLVIGGGLTRWLPAELAPYRWMVAPWAGYSLLVIITQFLTNEPFALTSLQGAYVAIAVGVGFWILDFGFWITTGRSKSKIQNPKSGIVWLIALVVFVLCVLPIWSYGYATVIGENWDVEVYLGLGEYLKAYPQSGLAAALPNPILDTLVNPPYSLRTHGFSYFQAALGMLPLDSLHTLAPLLALMRALSIPAVYIFFRVAMHLRPVASLVACALLGLNAFLLWITYNMFGMQVPTFGLLPLSLAAVCALSGVGSRESGVGSQESVTDSRLPTPDSRLPLWLGLFLAAIAITYHPALTAFVAMAVPIVVVLLAAQWRDGGAWRMLLSLGLAVVVALALSFVAQWKSLGGFFKQYGEQTAGLGLTGFTSPGDALGFSLSFRDLLPSDPGRPLYSLLSTTYGALGWVALLATLTLAAVYLYSLWRGEIRSRAWVVGALLAGAAAYTLAFVWPLNYPYGWFKALAFVSFVFIGAAVGGLWALLGLEGEGRLVDGRVARPVAAAGGVALVALVAVTTLLTLGRYLGQPMRYDREMVEAGAIRDVIANTGRDGSVYVSNSPNMQPLGRLFNGLLSYFLRDTDLYGKFDTGNSKLDKERPDSLYRFSLLHADDDPAEYGVSDARLAWHNDLLSLYESLPGGERLDIYHHNYRGDRAYPEIVQGVPLHMVLKGDSVELSTEPPSEQAVISATQSPVQVSLGLAAVNTTTLRISPVGRFSDPDTLGVQEIVLPPGYSTYRSPPLRGGEPVSLDVISTGDGTEQTSAYVRWAHMEEYRGAPGQNITRSAVVPGLLARVSSEQDGATILTHVDYLNNRPGAVSQTLSLDIYGSGAGGSSKHFGYWNVDVPAGVPISMSIGLDPSSKQVKFYGPPAMTEGDTFVGDAGDGSYTASLLVYENGRVSETFNDIFTFQVKDGELTSFKPRNLPPQFR